MKAQVLQLPLSLSAEDVYPYLGIKKEPVPAQVLALIKNYLQVVNRLAVPRGIWKHYTLTPLDQGRLILEDSNLIIDGPQTAAHFRNCGRITLLAATLGRQIDQRLEELSSQEPTQALFLDAVASAAAEHLSEQLDSHLSRQIRQAGFFPTARFSPGYSDWALSRQKEFLASVEAERIDIQATASFLMQPVKSITAAIGWSRSPVERNYSTPVRKKPCQGTMSCLQCPMHDHCHDN